MAWHFFLFLPAAVAAATAADSLDKLAQLSLAKEIEMG
jgi:hypothetical protein